MLFHGVLSLFEKKGARRTDRFSCGEGIVVHPDG